MPKFISFKSNLSSVLFWSIISAAFIGPGTVTSCTKSGAQFGYHLLWALTFSTIATILLQELVARISLATGKSIGEILSIKYQQEKSRWISKSLFLAIAFGCAAYETGNILGAVAGLHLFIKVPTYILTILISIVSFLILSKRSIGFISKAMGMLVLMMGIMFVYLVFSLSIDWKQVFYHSIVPSIPNNSGTLLIALVGTTIVPYNLFLGSGITHNQSLKEMRWGIIIAVGLGGLISMFILLAGTIVKGPFSFEAIYNAIEIKAGRTGAIMFALGLFAAGISSAITAPIAAAICGQSLFGNQSNDWKINGKNTRWTWIAVLAVGFIFSILNITPIPAIIIAQGINGILLPLVCIAMYLVSVDAGLLKPPYDHSYFYKYIYLIIIWVTGFLGIYNIQRAILRMLPSTNYTESKVIWISVLLSFCLIILLSNDRSKPK